MSLHIDFSRMGLDNATVSARFGGMYRAFFSALRQCDTRVTYSYAEPDHHADLLVVPMGGWQEQSSTQAIHAFDGPVVLYVPSAGRWFRPRYLARWRHRVLFAYGTDRSHHTLLNYRALKIPYYHLPFASDPEVMRPLSVPKLYDVIFVGDPASGTGRSKYVDALLSQASDRKLMFIGPGWERYGFPRQSVAWGDTLNVFYNLARVCVNIHNDQQNQGPDARLDANNRLFDLAMAGCFQVSNAPQIVRSYFSAEEVVAAESPEQWVAEVVFHLNHPNMREPYQRAARKRACAEHTWAHRACRFLELAEANLSGWQPTQTRVRFQRIGRMRDLHLPAYSPIDILRGIKRRLKRS